MLTGTVKNTRTACIDVYVLGRIVASVRLSLLLSNPGAGIAWMRALIEEAKGRGAGDVLGLALALSNRLPGPPLRSPGPYAPIEGKRRATLQAP